MPFRVKGSEKRDVGDKTLYLKHTLPRKAPTTFNKCLFESSMAPQIASNHLQKKTIQNCVFFLRNTKRPVVGIF